MKTEAVVQRSKGNSRAFLLDRMPKNSVCAEIGVFRGDFSAQIIKVVSPSILHLIDPWTFQPAEAYKNAWYGGQKGRDQNHLDSIYRFVNSRFAGEIRSGLVRIHRVPSGEACLQFDDEYFDWVYIDGDHRYEFVKQDFESFFPKVKTGGFIAGDDYHRPGWWNDGVRKAVDEFRSNHPCDVVLIESNQFLLTKLPLHADRDSTPCHTDARLCDTTLSGPAFSMRDNATDGFAALEDPNQRKPCKDSPLDRGITPTTISTPVFVLAAPRSFSGLVSAMLGSHPQTYALPATHLFSAETMADWWVMCSHARFKMADGLLRAVAELYFGEQTDSAIEAATGWLRRRSQFTTGLIFEAFADRVRPLRLVEKSPTLVSDRKSLHRVLGMFPNAKFIHVVQHPRAYGESLMRDIQEAANYGAVPYWMLHLASFSTPSAIGDGTPYKGLDPQGAWYALNSNVCEFFRRVPEDQKVVVRGEELLAAPGPALRRIAGWMGLGTDDELVEGMRHPERSPYASVGPSSARYGNENYPPPSPESGSERVDAYNLEDPISWRSDGQEFLPKVKELALHLGYE